MAGLKSQIITKAHEAGFDAVRFTRPDTAIPNKTDLRRFIEKGCHGDMAWFAANEKRRADPHVLWPQARSIIMLGVNYAPETNPLDSLGMKDHGVISVYARRKDYHDVIKKKLKMVARWLHGETGEDVKVFVDTAPVMEKPLAMAAGLGWQGKHTCLVSREFGSWLFLGEIFTTADLAADEAGRNLCGSCRDCLDICPTRAFLAPGKIDARRCLSYLNIEFKGHIAPDLRLAMGNRIFGCDDCLAVCPWNKFAKTANAQTLALRPELHNLPLPDLARLEDSAFRLLFAGTPVKRTGRERFVRNVLIAIGNSGNPGLGKSAVRLLGDPSPLIRAMAVWAAAKLLERHALDTLSQTHMPRERDPCVLAEWRIATDKESAKT
jgi:epoxyqueuosine reductase